ncbi:hypothetical protein VTH06DRAFT_2052 [Thermothelomyces fergusii]
MSGNPSIELSAREQPAAGASAPPAPAVDHSVYVPPQPGFAGHLQQASEGAGAKNEPGPSAVPPGYNHHQQQLPQGEAHIHPELRSGHEPPPPAPIYAPPIPNMIPQPAGVPHASQAVPMPAQPVAVAPAVGSTETGQNPPTDGRKAKRELSQSKRAAQNRAAQRAFRQRKEGYIKKLEQQVREYGEMENTFKAVQAENYALREYVFRLQSRLLDTQGEYPQPPPGLNLAQPNGQTQPANGSSEVPQPPAAAAPAAPGVNQVEVAAQAVAGLTRSEHLGDRDPYPPPVRSEDDRTAEEITRQLQADGGPNGLPPALCRTSCPTRMAANHRRSAALE